MNSPYLLEDINISTAWYKVFDHVIKCPGIEVSPLILTLTGFEECDIIRNTLDVHLRANQYHSIDTVAETIFPDSLYQICQYDSQELYRRYLRNLPRIRNVDSGNKRGTYFERLIAFDEKKKINQLEIIIKSLLDKNNKRRSKLQASIFDPTQDHLPDAYQKFPCLQHVTFYKSESGGLILNGFYAIQYLYQRAYGNWLGLVNLGKFVAREANMNFERFNCFIGIEKLDELTKARAKELFNKIDLKTNLP